MNISWFRRGNKTTKLPTTMEIILKVYHWIQRPLDHEGGWLGSRTWKIPNPSFVKIEFLCRRLISYHAHENYSAVKEVPSFGFRRFHIRKNEKSQNLVGLLTIHVQMCFSEIYRNQFDPSLLSSQCNHFHTSFDVT